MDINALNGKEVIVLKTKKTGTLHDASRREESGTVIGINGQKINIAFSENLWPRSIDKNINNWFDIKDIKIVTYPKYKIGDSVQVIDIDIASNAIVEEDMKDEVKVRSNTGEIRTYHKKNISLIKGALKGGKKKSLLKNCPKRKSFLKNCPKSNYYKLET